MSVKNKKHLKELLPVEQDSHYFEAINSTLFFTPAQGSNQENAISDQFNHTWSKQLDNWNFMHWYSSSVN